MFRLIKKHNSIYSSIILLAFTTIFFSLLLAGAAINWSFKKYQENSLNNYLNAYIDILTAATIIDEDDNISVSNGISIYNNMPFYWQIQIDQLLLKKSPSIQKQIDTNIINDGIYNSLIAGDDITFVVRRINFPNNRQVTYLFGMPSTIINALISEEEGKFNITLAIALILLAIFLIISVAYVQIRSITKPLARVANEIKDIQDGNKIEVTGDYPYEISLLSKELNNLISYNKKIIERYSNFAANLSHSLKTPITIIHNESQASTSKLAKLVYSKTNDLIAIIDRNLSRVKSVGNNNLLNENINLLKIVNKITDGFSKIYDKKISITCKNKDITFKGNESDLYEILGNIIENAFKYSNSCINVTLGNIDNNISIIIEDDGAGIPKDKISDVIKNGIRLDETKEGYGIGLSTAYQIINLYDGNLELTNSKLGGVKAIITFKYARINL